MSLEATTENVTKMAMAADALGSSIKFVFNGGEGAVLINGNGEENVVSNDDAEAEADCTINVDKADLDGMISGDLNPMAAFMSGKLKIEGDMGVAMKLSSLFS